MEKIIFEIKKKVEAYTLPDGLDVIPSYASIKSSKEELYTKYSSVTTTYNEVCKTLSNLQFSAVTVDRLLKELPNSNEVFSKQKLYAAELRTLKDEIKGMIEAYKFMKDGLEEAVRFYRSVQFILSSYTIPDV